MSRLTNQALWWEAQQQSLHYRLLPFGVRAPPAVAAAVLFFWTVATPDEGMSHKSS